MNSGVLVVQDDSEQTRQLVKFLSDSNSIGKVDVCYNGSDAIKKINEFSPGIVIIDLLLPILDGFAVMEYFSKRENAPDFIVFTVINKQQFVTKAFSCGAAYYMVKPAEPAQVLKRIIEISEPISTETEEIQSFKFRNHSLDERISSIFMSVGIPAHIKGYQFLREGIKLAVEDPPIINNITKSLYPTIASKFDTTSSKVERAIRHAIEVAWNRGKIENINSLFGIKVYSGNDKPTNGEFIALLADKMLLEGA